MSTTLLAAIADALIEFIPSLLGDPAAAADFAADPDSSLARAGRRLEWAARTSARSCRW